MNKQKIMATIASHKCVFKVVFGVLNRLPFNNSLGGVKADIGLSLLRKCKIVNHGTNNQIIVGDYSRLLNCTINIRGNNNTIVIGNHCVCNQGEFWIEDCDNTIEIGDDTALCGKIQLAAIEGTRINIGKRCLFSSGIDIRTGDSHSLIKEGTKERLNKSKDITIGNHVWVGTGVTILKGTTVAENCMVGAASLLCKSYTSPNCVLAGVPANEVRRDIDWLAERI